MAGIRSQHDPTAPGAHPHHLHPHGVPADEVKRDPRRQLAVAVVEGDPPLEDLVDHTGDVIGLERVAHCWRAHVRSGGEAHLALLQMIACRRELLEAADMVVVQMGDDHVGRARRFDPDHRQRFVSRAQKRPPPTSGILWPEPGVDDETSVFADRRPDEIVDRHGGVVVAVRGDEIV